MTKRALITGGAGFIGSHLCQRLLAEDWSVSVIDDLSTGRRDNLRQISGHRDFTFMVGNVRDVNMMEELVEGCDVIFHLAAAVGVKLIVERPVHTIETNIHGTEVVLGLANKYSKKVLLASTSEVYGKNENVPFSEDDDTVLGSTRFSRWSYACSKAIDEFLGFAYYDEYGLPVVAARLFNTIGPRQVGQYGMVVPRFIQRALANESIEIFGSGQQSRCFACIHDVVEGLIKLMESDAANGQVFNLGSDEEVTIEALADLIIQKTASRSEKKYLTYEQAYGREFDDMKRRKPSLEKIKKLVGYYPKINLDKTLDGIIDYFRELN